MIQVTHYGKDRKIAINPSNVFSIEDFGEYVVITSTDLDNFIKSSDDFDDILSWMDANK